MGAEAVGSVAAATLDGAILDAITSTPRQQSSRTQSKPFPEINLFHCPCSLATETFLLKQAVSSPTSRQPSFKTHCTM